MAKKKDETKTDLEELLKKYPKLADDEITSNVTQFISTGSTILDLAIGGGIAVRRITEIYGDESSGKSALGGHILANCQKMGGIAYIDDPETTFEDERAKIYGVDTKNTIYRQSDTVEECIMAMEAFIDEIAETKFDKPICMVVDSLAALMSEAEKDRTMLDSSYGAEKAKKMSEAFRRLARKISKQDVALVILNQTRDKIGGYGGKTTPGGNAPKFFSSCRIELDIKKKITNQVDMIVGVVSEAYTSKNKIASPFQTALFSIYFNRGIDDLISCFDYLIEEKIFEVKEKSKEEKKEEEKKEEEKDKKKTKKGWYEYNGKKYHYKDLFIELRDTQYDIKEQAIVVWVAKNKSE